VTDGWFEVRRRRPWTPEERIFWDHSDELARMHDHFEHRRDVERSHWWWLANRFEVDMKWDALLAAGQLNQRF
jgi:hypothetical protein